MMVRWMYGVSLKNRRRSVELFILLPWLKAGYDLESHGKIELSLYMLECTEWS